MAYVFCNPNPDKNLTGDCVVRAVSLLTDKDWETVFLEIMVCAYEMHDMPSSNAVWAKYLHENGFKRGMLPDTCPDCYTIKDFAEEYNQGKYLVGTGTHAVAVLDGDYYDTWDSGDEVPIYYWTKEED